MSGQFNARIHVHLVWVALRGLRGVLRFGGIMHGCPVDAQDRKTRSDWKSKPQLSELWDRVAK
jgi:hypothetical protein